MLLILLETYVLICIIIHMMTIISNKCVIAKIRLFRTQICCQLKSQIDIMISCIFWLPKFYKRECIRPPDIITLSALSCREKSCTCSWSMMRKEGLIRRTSLKYPVSSSWASLLQTEPWVGSPDSPGSLSTLLPHPHTMRAKEFQRYKAHCLNLLINSSYICSHSPFLRHFSFTIKDRRAPRDGWFFKRLTI